MKGGGSFVVKWVDAPSGDGCVDVLWRLDLESRSTRALIGCRRNRSACRCRQWRRVQGACRLVMWHKERVSII